jgi:hypothetical protein
MAWGLPREPKYEERVASEIELREEYVGYPHPASTAANSCTTSASGLTASARATRASRPASSTTT